MLVRLRCDRLVMAPEMMRWLAGWRAGWLTGWLTGPSSWLAWLGFGWMQQKVGNFQVHFHDLIGRVGLIGEGTL